MSELLLVLQLFISENGGNERLANKIESEWIKLPMTRAKFTTRPAKRTDWSTKEEVLLKNCYQSVDKRVLANSLNKTIESIYSKAKRMGLQK